MTDERMLRELELVGIAKLYGWSQAAAADVPVMSPEAPQARSLPDVQDMDWQALEEAVRVCTQCGLCKQRKQAVFGVGARSGPWMFIGEGPGADEDRIGRPFVGRAGQLLDRMLAAIQLDRESVHITNVVYWRPPGNRTPTTAEIASCLPFVLRHIALVHPKILVLAGGTATGALLPGGQGITRLRGRWFDLEIPGLTEPVPTLPMFHPSFLLRTPERKREAWRDLLALRARLDDMLRNGGET